MARVRLLPSAEPNVIPFIDVLLVLVIIFMVTAPTPTVDLHVDLPPPHPSYIEGSHPTVVALVALETGFSLTVDDEPVSIDDLGQLTLAHARADNPNMPLERVFADARVYVRADQGTAYGNVVDVMNRLREARFARVSIYAQRAEEG